MRGVTFSRDSYRIFYKIFYYRLWRDLNLDAVIDVSYAPNDSKMNPIERDWSFVSNLMTGVTLPITLNGETVPPWLQSDLSAEGKEKKLINYSLR